MTSPIMTGFVFVPIGGGECIFIKPKNNQRTKRPRHFVEDMVKSRLKINRDFTMLLGIDSAFEHCSKPIQDHCTLRSGHCDAST